MSYNFDKKTKIWILGAGKFGCKALKKLSSHFDPDNITTIDHDYSKLKTLNCHTIQEDVLSWLHQHKGGMDNDDIIIPAVPIHVAYEWMKTELLDQYTLSPEKIPDKLFSKLPNPIPGPEGRIYTSVADFFCPEDCPEPADICTYTGQPRDMKLNVLIQSLKNMKASSVVIRSIQLVPGAGGFSVKSLVHGKEDLLSKRERIILLATACRCHGVIDCFRMKRFPK